MIQLDKNQKKAVEAIYGPVLLIAGAGAGKTRVLTERVAYMLKNNIPGQEILAVTFTNKAADEMRERISKIPGSKEVTIKTIHGLCFNILKDYQYYLQPLGFPMGRVSVIDTDDALSLFEDYWLNAYDEKLPKKEGKEWLNKFSLFINRGRKITPKEYKHFLDYQKLKKRKLLLDFDDLLIYTAKLIEQPEVLKGLQKQWKFFSVDEYQDTNLLQAKILLTLSNQSNNICVVGDADQSIYGFRGATLSNIFQFEDHFKKKGIPITKIYLETNYRSSADLVKMSNRLISYNSNRKGAPMLANQEEKNRGNTPLKIVHNASSEAQWVVEKIKEKIDQGEPLEEIAVLYRNNYFGNVIQKELVLKEIPYQVLGGKSFLTRKVVKDLVSFVQFLDRPEEALFFKNIINTPSVGIGPKKIEEWENKARENKQSLWDYLSDKVENKRVLNKQEKRIFQLKEFVKEYRENASTFKGWSGLELPKSSTIETQDYLLNQLIERHLPTNNLAKIIAEYINKIYIEEMAKVVEEKINKNEDADIDEDELVIAVLDVAEANSQAENFIEKLVLGDKDGPNEKDEKEEGKVTLSTIHSSKGLEWDVVFIIQLNDGSFPRNPRPIDLYEERELEEERRCMYVGMTRAKEELFLSCTQYDRRNQPVEISIFIQEILARTDRYDPDDDIIILNKPDLLTAEK